MALGLPAGGIDNIILCADSYKVSVFVSQSICRARLLHVWFGFVLNFLQSGWYAKQTNKFGLKVSVQRIDLLPQRPGFYSQICGVKLTQTAFSSTIDNLGHWHQLTSIIVEVVQLHFQPLIVSPLPLWQGTEFAF